MCFLNPPTVALGDGERRRRAAEAEKQPPARWSSRVSLEHHGGGRIPVGNLVARTGLPRGDPACVSPALLHVPAAAWGV